MIIIIHINAIDFMMNLIWHNPPWDGYINGTNQNDILIQLARSSSKLHNMDGIQVVIEKNRRR